MWVKFKSALKKVTRVGNNVFTTFAAVATVGSQMNGAYQDYANGKAVRKDLPKITALLSSLEKFIGNADFVNGFNMYLGVAGVVAQYVDVLQGGKALAEVGLQIKGELEAQTGLQAPEAFAKQVRLFIDQRISEESQSATRSGVKHAFFLYHPDSDWHPHFYESVRRKALPINFLGISQNLDSICVWMKFVRALNSQQGGKTRMKFHLLIPAYRPMVITEPLKFPDDVFPLAVEGFMHNSIEYVWLNLPGEYPDQFSLSNIGNMAKQSPEISMMVFTALGLSAAGYFASLAVEPPLIPIAAGGLFGSLGTFVAAACAEYRARTPRTLGGDFDSIECIHGMQRIEQR
ncbi:hypothetical protein NHQ30_005031 [Ciborinia camelliae]|nr:hypothetical protein NHQ30_005031 [Ciborinia camelliae]